MSQRRHKPHVVDRAPGADDTQLGSHSRVPGGVVGCCALCERQSTLQLSHVVPKWMHRRLYSPSGVAPLLFSGGYGQLTREQDGRKFYLLCRGCEAHVGVAEAYCARVFGATSGQLRRVGVLANGIYLTGLRAEHVQRVLLATLVRSHFAPEPLFGTEALPAEMIPTIRRLILDGQLAPERFPIVGSRWVPSNGNVRLIQGFAVVHFSECARTQLPVFELLSSGWAFRLFLDADGKLAASSGSLVLRDGAPFPMRFDVQIVPDAWA